MELVAVTIVLTIVIAMVTLIGHGLWLMFASFFRRAFADPTDSQRERARRVDSCPVCRAHPMPQDRHCYACGWRDDPLTGPLAIAERQVARLAEQGLIDESTRSELVSAFVARRIQMLGPSPVVTSPEVTSRSSTAPIAVESPPSHDIIVASLVDASDVPSAAEPRSITSPITPQSAPATADVADSVRERARQYAVQRGAATSVPPPIPLPPGLVPPAPTTPRRSWQELVATFMEERNMRWGELVGGLLIVSCSIALVVSFWSEIAERPILKFGVFNGVTASLFVLGIHAWRRWKLPTTSQGILLIATLLVPLNFIAIVAFTTTPTAHRLLTIVGEIVSTAIFGYLLYGASQILTPRRAWALTFGVLAPSVASLYIGRYLTPQSPPLPLFAIAIFCTASYMLAACIVVPWRRLDEVADEPMAHHTLKLLGGCSFAVALAAVLLVFRIRPASELLHQLAPAIVILSIPTLSNGLYLWRRSDLAWIGLTGTCVAAGGALLLATSLILAWPSPGWLMVTALTSIAILTWMTWQHQAAGLHLAVAIGAVIAYLMGAYLIQRNVGWNVANGREIVGLLQSANTGRLLVGFVMAYVAGAVVWRTKNRQFESLCYLSVAAACGAASLLFVSLYGFGRAGDPESATEVYAIYTIGAIVASIIVSHWIPATIGMGLLLVTCIQAIVFRWEGELGLTYRWSVAFLTHAACGAVGGLIAHYQQQITRIRFIPTVSRWSLLSLLCVMFLFVQACVTGGNVLPAIHLGFFAMILLAIAWVNNSRPLFFAFQIAVTVFIAVRIHEYLETATWFASVEHRWVDPWTLEYIGIGLALTGLLWVALRQVSMRLSGHSSATDDRSVSAPRIDPDERHPWKITASFLANPADRSFDQYVAGALVALVLGLTLYGVVPGVARELTTDAAMRSLSLTTVPSGSGTPRFVPSAENFEFSGIPHGHVLNRAMWLLIGATCLLLAAHFGERPERWKLEAAGIVAGCGLLLGAAYWESELAVASAARWISSVAFLGVAALDWCRNPIARWHAALRTRLGQLAIADQHDRTDSAEAYSSRIASCLIIIPLLLLTGGVTVATLMQVGIVGPNPESFFAQLGPSLSYATPLAFVMVGLCGFAVRERSAQFAFGAGLMLNGVATVYYLLAPNVAPLSFLELQRVLEINALASGIVALVWGALLAREWWTIERAAQRNSLYSLQVLLGLIFAGLALGPPALVLFVSPSTATPLYELGGIWGWPMIAVVLAGGVVRWLCMRDLSMSSLLPSTGLLLVTLLVAYEVHRWDSGNWLSYHFLLVLLIIAGGISFVVAVGRDVGAIRNQVALTRRSLRGSGVLAALAVLFALRAVFSDPQRPWWTVGGLLACSAITVGRGCVSQRRRLLYRGALFIVIATTVWWGHQRNAMIGPAGDLGVLADMLHVNLIALALPTLFWIWVDRRFWQPTANNLQIGTGQHVRVGLGVHRLLVPFSMLCLALSSGLLFAANINSGPIDANWVVTSLACSVVGIGILSCLWDRYANWVLAMAYVWGLATIVLITARLNVAHHQLFWTLTMAVAAYGVGTSYLWSRRRGLIRLARSLHVPHHQRTVASQMNWMISGNGLLILFVAISGFTYILSFTELPFRFAASQGILAQVFSLGMLARGKRRTVLRTVSLLLGVCGAIAFGWSWLNPHQATNPLNHLVTAAAAFGAMAIFYGIGLSKIRRREDGWSRAAQSTVPTIVALALGTIAITLIVEVYYYVLDGAVPISWPALVAIIVTFVGLASACLVAAVVPGRDPLGLSERQRMIYVYAAEAILALLFLHIRITMPWLFRGFFLRYWPLVVMLIAYIGIGISEWFRRREKNILAEPLENTGAFLPIVPVIGYWVAPGEVHYSTLMLVVGVMYAGLSVMRRSFLFGVLAALATNSSLWYLLYRTDGLGLLEHPQVWIIPPALCVLVAAFVNRDRMNASQLTSVRYLASSAIYVSSASDIFLNGVAEAPWLPFVLAGLALCGIFAGIALKIRSFLFLGLSFLVLALFTIVWFAAVDLQQTWLWYVCGIVVGIAIIAIFALFEKKRADMLAIMEELKHWNG